MAQRPSSMLQIFVLQGSEGLYSSTSFDKKLFRIKNKNILSGLKNKKKSNNGVFLDARHVTLTCPTCHLEQYTKKRNVDKWPHIITS